MLGLAIVFGTLVGFALGLTGAGGGIFAVPLMVHGLAVDPREAVGISLAAVGGTALFGLAPRLFRHEVDLRTGLMFAVAGMLGAPVGNYLSSLFPGHVLLTLFGMLMLVVSWRMWPTSSLAKLQTSAGLEPRRPVCVRGEDEQLILNSRCAAKLAAIGLAIGVLSGMFGVGGGFMIVPALVLFSGMKIHHAMATSLLVIFLVSVSGVTSYLAMGNHLSVPTMIGFLTGGFVGMWGGSWLAKDLRGPTLQRVFAVGVVFVALFVISKSILA
jgi:uncharacterized membrane protein YfcA